MTQKPVEENTELAVALLTVVPRILSRIGADVPIDGEVLDENPHLREVSELRATPGQLSLLQVLVEHERCTMQELAEHLVVVPSTATAMVKRLLAQGYVERLRGEEDWRTVWVKATERGRRAVTVFNEARLASLKCRLKRLDEAERQSILAALPALRHLVEV
jgi:DNA-binding MarR family transcriptional regulator